MPDVSPWSRRVLAGAKAIGEMIETMAMTIGPRVRGEKAVQFVGVGARGLALAERLRGKTVPESPEAVELGSASSLQGCAAVLVCDVLAADQVLAELTSELSEQTRAVAALVACRGRGPGQEPDVVGMEIDLAPGQRVEVHLLETDPKERVVLVTR